MKTGVGRLGCWRTFRSSLLIAALFYTPPENIPIDYIGSGPIDITLPGYTLKDVQFEAAGIFDALEKGV
jgi:hypothetical protein